MKKCKFTCNYCHDDRCDDNIECELTIIMKDNDNEEVEPECCVLDSSQADWKLKE